MDLFFFKRVIFEIFNLFFLKTSHEVIQILHFTVHFKKTKKTKNLPSPYTSWALPWNITSRVLRTSGEWGKGKQRDDLKY